MNRRLAQSDQVALGSDEEQIAEIAGVAMMTSPMEFLANSSNFGPDLTTNTSPSSLAKYSFPSAATGEAENELPGSRRFW